MLEGQVDSVRKLSNNSLALFDKTYQFVIFLTQVTLEEKGTKLILVL